MIAFQNRTDEIKRVCAVATDEVLLNLFGETGIGKTRLLAETGHRLRSKSSPVLVIQLDLKHMAEMPDNRTEALLRELITQADPWLSGFWHGIGQLSGQVVAQLVELSGKMSVYMMFDTTEALQEDMGFWSWMEEYLVGPLVVEGGVKLVFAGRVPVPWRRYEVRRVVRYLRLDPLSPREAAGALVREVFLTQNPNISDDQVGQAVDLVLEFSFMHPKLTEDLAVYLASEWESTPFTELRTKFCPKFVKAYIENELFMGIDEPWSEILWWLSVLDWFDPMILRKYLERVVPDLVDGQSDYFYIEGITSLRIRNTVVWREERGDRLHGIIKDITRHCLEMVDPERYRCASLAAAETFEALANEFPKEYPENEQYLKTAQAYARQANLEVGQ